MDYFLETKKERPNTALEIPARFDLLASCDEILHDCLECDLDERGTILIPEYQGLKSKRKSQHLDNLFLNISGVDDENIDRLIKEILKKSNFVFGIRLSAPNLKPKSLEKFVLTLLPASKLNYLIELDMSYLNLPNSARDLLCKTINTIISGYCPIKRLILTRTHLGVHGCEAIWKALYGNIFIEEVIINGNQGSDLMLPTLIKCLSHSQSRLRVLGLGSNDITARGMRLLGPAIGAHNFMEEIYLHDNPIGDEGVDLLFKDLKDNNSLSMINLCRCNIKKCAWGAKLRIMLNLRTLILGCNMIDDEGFQGLCDGLLNCTCLRHIDISYNRFGAESCKVIGRVLQDNRGLISLNLSGNYMHKEVWKTLGFSVNDNKTLNTLDLRYCGLTQTLAQQFCSALADNNTCTVLLDMNPISYVMRSNAREWDPALHSNSNGVNTLGYTMQRDKKAPTLRELRKKERASRELQAASGVRLKAAAAMERLEFAADPLRANLDPHTAANPIQRSDKVPLDPETFGRQAASLSYDYHARTLNASMGWRDARLKEIKEARSVVGLLKDRGSNKEKRKGKDKFNNNGSGSLDDDLKSLSAALSAVEIAKANETSKVMTPSPTPSLSQSQSKTHSLSGSRDVSDDSSVISTQSISTMDSSSTMHITPSLAAMRVKRAEAVEVSKREATAGRRRILSVVYGNRDTLLGSLEVLDSTTYDQAKEMIVPQVREFLSNALLTTGRLPQVGEKVQMKALRTISDIKKANDSKKKENKESIDNISLMNDSHYENERRIDVGLSMKNLDKREEAILTRQLVNFKILDWQGLPVTGNEAHIRCVWQELSRPEAGMNIVIQPGDAMTLEGEEDGDDDEWLPDEDADGDVERRADAYD